MDICDKRIEELEKKFNEFEEKNKEQQNEFIDLKNQFFKLKEEYDQLVKLVLENKEQINILLKKLKEVDNDYKEGDENLKKKIESLKKNVDEKLLELNTKLELLLNNMNGGGGIGNGKKFDLSGLDDFMQKLSILENKFDEFVTKVNVDEIYTQLRYLNVHKADKDDVDKIKEILNDLNKKYQEHKEQIEVINNRLDALYEQVVNIEKEPDIPKDKEDKNIVEKKIFEKNRKEVKKSIGGDNLDSSKYTLKTDFDSFRKDNIVEINKLWEEINKIKEIIDNLSKTIKEKADTEDLNGLRDFILGKIDELIKDSNKKYSDKNDTIKSLKYLEEQIKKLKVLLKSRKNSHNTNDADNWLIAKKPINGFSCAACESYLGDLKNGKSKFIPWNKLPVRDQGDRIYRLGNGFSKMLNMLNFDNNGNASLNPNITLSDESEIENEKNDKIVLDLKMNEPKSTKNNKTLLKNRHQSASTPLVNDAKDNNIKLGHKTQNNFFNKDEIKSKYLPNIKKDISAGVFEKATDRNDESPKITKILKKSQKKIHIKEKKENV